MEVIYNILESIMPFSFMHYDFMKNALIAIVLVSPIFAVLGTMVVNNKMAFFSDSLGHSAIAGIAIGMIFGITNSSLAMILFAVLFAILLNYVRHRTEYGADTIISVFSSITIAIGLIVLARSGGFNKYSSYLVGDILSIEKIELLYLAISFILTFILWFFLFNKIHSISINSVLAKSKGINVKLIDNIFVIMVAIIVMLSLRWIGILLINSLLILPAASSRNIATSIRRYHVFSILFSLSSGIAGIVISYYTDMPTGPMIVIILGMIFFITLVLKRKIK